MLKSKTFEIETKFEIRGQNANEIHQNATVKSENFRARDAHNNLEETTC